jgi:predicted AAA+ superfamily ATPase
MLCMAWTPTADDLREALERQNPWFELGDVPEALAPAAERALAALLPAHLVRAAPQRSQFILGPRRVGKSTTMYQAVKRLLDGGIPARRLVWLRLDHPAFMGLPLGGLVETVVRAAGATAEAPVFLFLDELTWADSWDLWLKTFFDERWPVRIVATSSSTAALRDRRLESGVGRWEEQHLAPWSFVEYLRLRSVPVDAPPTLAAGIEAIAAGGRPVPGAEPHLRRYLLVGGFPELLNLPGEDEVSDVLRSQRVLRADAVERAVYKDIPQVFSVTEPMKLERLLYTLAGQFTGLLSPSALAADLGLTQLTIDRYVAYLEQAFLVFTLPNYSPSEETVQRRGRKLYFWDGAVRNAALQHGIRPRNDATEMGHLRENAVAAHLRALSEQTGARLYHWRQGRSEVDFVYDDPEAPFAFGIASQGRHSSKGLRDFQERHPRFRGRCYLVSADATTVAAGPDPGHLPLTAFLVAAGAAAEAAQARRFT